MDLAPERNLFSIQYLRGMAAMLVVYHHARDQFAGFRELLPAPIGAGGVDLFFVISGFIMVVVTGLRQSDYKSFLLRRIVRIIPIYWFYTLITALLLLLLPSVFHNNELTLSHLVLSLLFVPHASPSDATSLSPMLKLGWTLNYEMYFYVVFAALLFLPLSNRVLALGFTFLVLVVFGLVFTPTAAPLQFYTSPIILEFGLGAIIGYFYLREMLVCWPRKTMLILVGLSALAILVVGSHLTEEPKALERVFIFGIPAAFLMLTCCSLEVGGSIRNWPWLRIIGDASYSIYLAHLFPLVAMRWLWSVASLPVSGWIATVVFVCLALILGLTAGLLSYVVIERPMLGLLRGRMKQEAQVRVMVTAPAST